MILNKIFISKFQYVGFLFTVVLGLFLQSTSTLAAPPALTDEELERFEVIDTLEGNNDQRLDGFTPLPTFVVSDRDASEAQPEFINPINNPLHLNFARHHVIPIRTVGRFFDLIYGYELYGRADVELFRRFSNSMAVGAHTYHRELLRMHNNRPWEFLDNTDSVRVEWLWTRQYDLYDHGYDDGDTRRQRNAHTLARNVASFFRTIAENSNFDDVNLHIPAPARPPELDQGTDAGRIFNEDVYRWVAYIPWNIFIGYDNRSDDPGEGFEQNAGRIISSEQFGLLSTLYVFMSIALDESNDTRTRANAVAEGMEQIMSLNSRFPFYTNHRPANWIQDGDRYRLDTNGPQNDLTRVAVLNDILTTTEPSLDDYIEVEEEFDSDAIIRSIIVMMISSSSFFL